MGSPSGSINRSLAPLLGNAGGMRTVVFGHSYADQEADNASYGRPTNLMRGTVNWANIFLNKALRVVYNGGVGGERITDWLDRFERDCAQYNPQIVIITDPINDLKNTRNTTQLGTFVRNNAVYPTDYLQSSLPTVISRYKELIQKIHDIGAVAVCMGVSPPNPAESVPLGARCAQFNAWLRRYSANNRNIIFAPVHLATVDPASTSGISLSGAYADSIHPSADNSFLRGRILARCLANLVPPYWDPLIYTIGDAMVNTTLTVANMVVSQGGCQMTLNNNSVGYGDGQMVGIVRVGDILTYNSQSVPDLNGAYRINSAPVGTSAVLTGVKISNTARGMNGSDATGGQEAYVSFQGIDNPLFITTTGGSKSGAGSAKISGNVPGNMSVTNDNNTDTPAVTLTTAAHTDSAGNATGFGNWLIADVAVTIDTEVKFIWPIHRDELVLASYAYGKFFPGEVLQSEIEVEVVGASGGAGSPSGINKLQFMLEVTLVIDGVDTGLTVTELFRYTSHTDAFPNRVFRGVLQTPEWKLVENSKSKVIDVSLTLKVLAGGSVRLRMARVSAEKVFYDTEREGLTRFATV